MSGSMVSLSRDEERHAQIRQFLLICSSFLALPLYLVFWLADLIYAPEQKWLFLGLRLAIVPVCLTTNALVRRAKNLNQAQTVGTIFVFLNSIIITTMIILSRDGAGSPYYAGLNLVAIGMVYIPWTTPYLAVILGLIYVPLTVSAPFLPATDPRRLGINLFFITGTVIISVVIRTIMEMLRNREFESRQQLHEELASRARIIRRKTAEAVQLKTLTKQFSPQVVHYLQSADASAFNQIQRAEICAIFIDIVESTRRIRSISNERTNKVITFFMEDTMKVLLKHDITIDKFLGDGVLGFSNAPVQRDDYITRAIDAALEVRARIQAKGDIYAHFWGDDFRVRLGLAVGPAEVGFYGSEEYFKSYTAIGEVVNFASRICDSASPNSIVVSQDIVKKVLPNLYEVKELGFTKLKGFEKANFSLFEVIGSAVETIESADKEISVCPRGHGVLHLDTDENGIYVLLCRVCKYTQSEGEEATPRKAA